MPSYDVIVVTEQNTKGVIEAEATEADDSGIRSYREMMERAGLKLKLKL